MEIKVGDFVRTKGGGIYRLGYFNKSENRWICNEVDDWYPVYENEIVKHSPNIIDLIEEGDYVNGKEVKHIAMFEGFPDYPKLIFVDEQRLIPGETAENDEIKSIVTKEQYNQMKYIVGDE